MARKKIMRSAIDAGFRWSAEHRRLREVVEGERHWSGGINSYGYAVNMFASAAQFRDFWERGRDEDLRVHLTPLGTYFSFQGNSGSVDWTGAYVRSDGTTGKFRGRHNYPLYCIGCGRADFRLAQEYTCDERLTIPAELLIKLPKNPAFVRPVNDQRADEAWLEKVRLAAQAPATKPPPVAVPLPPSKPVSTRPVSSLAYAPPQQPSYWESKARGAASSAWATLKFLFLMLLLAIAAGHH